MKFGWTIVYVADIAATVAFYERAFGLQPRFVSDDNTYAELATGETTLAFAADSMADAIGVTVRPNRATETAAGVEIAFVTDKVEAAFQHAVAAGAVAVLSPAVKPWGQTVSYVRDNNGLLVEICSPVAS